MRTKLTQKDIIDNSNRLVIKIGTNSIIDVENWTVKGEWLQKSIRSYVELEREFGVEFGIVSSGAIGMARVALNGAVPKTVGDKQAFAGKGQTPLIMAYQRELARHNLEGAQILFTKHDLTSEPYLSNTRNALAAFRRMGIIYVANENDTVATDEIKIGDNDTLGALTAIADEANTLVLITDVNGLYKTNPKLDKNAEHIQIVESLTPDIMALGGGSIGTHGTGGMRTKLDAAFLASACGINTIIVNGTNPDCLTRLFNGDYRHATFIPHTAHPQLGLF